MIKGSELLTINCCKSEQVVI